MDFLYNYGMLIDFNYTKGEMEMATNVKEFDLLEAICMSYAKKPDVKGRYRKEGYKTNVPDHRLTITAKCEICAASRSVTFNRIWDADYGVFRLQLLEVLPDEAKHMTVTKIAKICNNCTKLVENYLLEKEVV